MQSTFKKSSHLESNFELQITALIDTLVIILIFLLKSISTDTLELEQSKGISVPGVMNGISSGTGSRLEISAEAISWNGQKYIETVAFDGQKPLNGEAGWAALNMAIAATANAEKAEKKFDGKLLLQADRHTPLPALREALRAAKKHGYRDIRFVGVKYN